MVTMLLVHGVGGASDKARWLEPLNRRLAEFHFSELAAPADDILVPDYSGLFDVKEFREPAVTYCRPDDRRLSRQKIDYAVRQKTLERQVRPVPILPVSSPALSAASAAWRSRAATKICEV